MTPSRAPTASPSTSVTRDSMTWRQRLHKFGRGIGVRTRSVLVAVGVVFVALLLGLAGLVVALQANLEQTAEANAHARVSEVVARLSTDGLAATEEALTGRSGGNSAVQILDSHGTVLSASSRDVAGRPLSSQRPEIGDYQSTEVDLDLPHGTGGEWRVVTTAVDLDGARYYVQAAVPITEQREMVRTVALFLFAGTPLLLGAVALAVWMLVGGALGAVEEIRSAVADIDAHRLARRVEVPPTHDEIAALATTMNSMLDRLQAAARAQQAFVSDASHELRSPLATLTTAGELAVSASREQQPELLATMNAEIARLRGLVDNLMILARADGDDADQRRVDVDLDDLVTSEARRLRLTDGCTVSVEIAPARVLADEQRLTQALRNLVDNAARHARTAVRLIVTTTATDAVVWVDNDGPPIAVTDRERVFERFVRLDEARSRDAGGSGLGLAITRAILRGYGGEATVVDSPDNWCRFQVRLPLNAIAEGDGRR